MQEGEWAAGQAIGKFAGGQRKRKEGGEAEAEGMVFTKICNLVTHIHRIFTESSHCVLLILNGRVYTFHKHL